MKDVFHSLAERLCVCAEMCICIYINWCLYTCVYKYVKICMGVHTHVCVSASVSVCLCRHMLVFIQCACGCVYKPVMFDDAFVCNMYMYPCTYICI